jgi:AcrR family transcriptional regulator
MQCNGIPRPRDKEGMSAALTLPAPRFAVPVRRTRGAGSGSTMSGTTRERLVNTAFELFGRGGFHGVGLDRIIDEAGVSKQTFYNHFECKDNLVLAVLDHRHEVQGDQLHKWMAEIGGDTPRGKLYALMDALDRWMSQPDWLGCIFMTAAAEFPLPNDPAHQKAAEHTRLLREHLQYLATLAGARDPATLACQLSVIIDGVIVMRHTLGDHSCVRIGKEMARKLLDESLPPAPVDA